MVETADIFQDLSNSSLFTNSILLHKSQLSANNKDSIALEGFDLDIEEEEPKYKEKKGKGKKNQNLKGKAKQDKSGSKLLSENS